MEQTQKQQKQSSSVKQDGSDEKELVRFLAVEEELPEDAYQLKERLLRKKWEKRYAYMKGFPQEVANANFDFLLSFDLLGTYDEIANESGFNKTRAEMISQFVWQAVLKGKLDEVGEEMATIFHLKDSAKSVFLKSLNEKVVDILMELDEERYPHEKNEVSTEKYSTQTELEKNPELKKEDAVVPMKEENLVQEGLENYSKLIKEKAKVAPVKEEDSELEKKDEVMPENVLAEMDIVKKGSENSEEITNNIDDDKKDSYPEKDLINPEDRTSLNKNDEENREGKHIEDELADKRVDEAPNVFSNDILKTKTLIQAEDIEEKNDSEQVSLQDKKSFVDNEIGSSIISSPRPSEENMPEDNKIELKNEQVSELSVENRAARLNEDMGPLRITGEDSSLHADDGSYKFPESGGYKAHGRSLGLSWDPANSVRANMKITALKKENSPKFEEKEPYSRGHKHVKNISFSYPQTMPVEKKDIPTVKVKKTDDIITNPFASEVKSAFKKPTVSTSAAVNRKFAVFDEGLEESKNPPRKSSGIDYEKLRIKLDSPRTENKDIEKVSFSDGLDAHNDLIEKMMQSLERPVQNNEKKEIQIKEKAEDLKTENFINKSEIEKEKISSVNTDEANNQPNSGKVFSEDYDIKKKDPIEIKQVKVNILKDKNVIQENILKEKEPIVEKEVVQDKKSAVGNFFKSKKESGDENKEKVEVDSPQKKPVQMFLRTEAIQPSSVPQEKKIATQPFSSEKVRLSKKSQPVKKPLKLNGSSPWGEVSIAKQSSKEVGSPNITPVGIEKEKFFKEEITNQEDKVETEVGEDLIKKLMFSIQSEEKMPDLEIIENKNSSEKTLDSSFSKGKKSSEGDSVGSEELLARIREMKNRSDQTSSKKSVFRITPVGIVRKKPAISFNYNDGGDLGA